MKDETKKIAQTFNIQKGGQQEQGAANVEYFQALQAKLWSDFFDEITTFCSENPQCGVRGITRDFVSESGYPLGKRLNDVKNGAYLGGNQDRMNQLKELPYWGNGDWSHDKFNFENRSKAQKKSRAIERATKGEDVFSKRAKEWMAEAKQEHGDDIFKRRALEIAQRNKEKHGDDVYKKRTKRRWENNPDGLEPFMNNLHKGRDEFNSDRSKAILDKALQQPPHPYEPVKKKRVAGEFYWRQDGKLARCEFSTFLKPLKMQPNI